MDQHWTDSAKLEVPRLGPWPRKHNRDRLMRSESLGIIALVSSCLVWQVISGSSAVFLLLGLLILAYINYLIGGRDVLYPAFTYTAIWSVVVAAFIFCPIEVYPIGWKTVAIVLAGGASFSVGSWLGNRPFIKPKLVESVSQYRDNPQARNILLACTIFVTLLFLATIVKLAGGVSSLLSLAFLLRLNSPSGPLEDADLFTTIIVGSGGLLPVLTLWVMIMEERRRWKIAVCTICACLFPLLVTQRGLVLGAICGCISLYLLKCKDRSFRKMGAPLGLAALGVVSLMTIMSLTKYWVQEPGGTGITTGAWQYITGPLAAFDYAVYHPEHYEDQPAAVFAQVLTPLAHLELIRYRSSLEVDGSALDRFIYVPFPANVYTAYKPYYEDFGALGCFVAFTFLGLVEGLLFHSAIRGNAFATILFAHLSGALMFSTFDDFYHGFSRDLNIIVFAIGYFWLMKRIRLRL